MAAGHEAALKSPFKLKRYYYSMIASLTVLTSTQRKLDDTSAWVTTAREDLGMVQMHFNQSLNKLRGHPGGLCFLLCLEVAYMSFIGKKT